MFVGRSHSKGESCKATECTPLWFQASAHQQTWQRVPALHKLRSGWKIGWVAGRKMIKHILRDSSATSRWIVCLLGGKTAGWEVTWSSCANSESELDNQFVGCFLFLFLKLQSQRFALSNSFGIPYGCSFLAFLPYTLTFLLHVWMVSILPGNWCR